MLIECFAIMALILAIFFIYLRLKRVQTALTVLPLIGVPFSHSVSQLLLIRLAPVLSIDVADVITIVTIVDIAALVISSLSCGALSFAYEKKFRVSYLVIVGLFNVVLTCILLVNLKIA